MKKIGLIAVTLMALMSCNGGANDGNPNTDTTTFPSEMKIDTSTTGLGGGTDSNDRVPSSVGSNPTSSPSRGSTPGNAGGKEDSSTNNSGADNPR